MRVWEVENDKAIPTDLVREQDFILRVRRLHRLGTPHLVINLVLGAMQSLGSRRALEAMQEKLRDFAKVTNGTFADMSNGDVFISWEETADANILSSRVIAAILPEDHQEDVCKIVLTYHLPQDYPLLRERANYYVEIVQSAALLNNNSPSEVLKSYVAHGGLTAWSVDQIGKLLDDIDLRRYSRVQPVYRRDDKGVFAPQWEEHFISFEDLRRERFPKIDIITPEHLFLALCETLDQKLLAGLTESYDTLAGRSVSFNLSVSTVMGSVFAGFAHRVPASQHHYVGFEIHRGDLLQDFARTLSAIEVLRREKFRVALDSVTPDMLPYLNTALFDVDYIKVNVSKDRVELLKDPAIRKALAQIPAEKIVFFRCDNEAALAAGVDLGVRYYQGWLIDDKAAKKV